jgi:hypothetical protein
MHVYSQTHTHTHTHTHTGHLRVRLNNLHPLSRPHHGPVLWLGVRHELPKGSELRVLGCEHLRHQVLNKVQVL